MYNKGMTAKVVTIIRGVSGSGKSTFGVFLKMLACNDTRICTADDFFTDEETGEYNFNPELIGVAHKVCREKFEGLIDEGVSHVIVNNTSTKPREFKHYKEYAEEAGYKVFVIAMENWHGGTNIHNVPAEVLVQQEKNLKNSFKPI